MKKRSLLAAVAMLVVSAIVLTSATFAWFVTGGNGAINGVNVELQAASSGIVLKTSATGAVWKGTLGLADLTADGSGSHIVATTYAPVSILAAVGSAPAAATITLGSLDAQSAFTTAAASAGTEYSEVVTNIKITDTAENATSNVNCGITFGPGSAASAMKVAVYFNNALIGIYGNDGTAYSAINSNVTAADGVVDSNNNGIIETTDTNVTGTMLASQAVTQIGASCFTLNGVTNTGMQTLRAVIWIEGQDADCTNALGSATSSVSFSFVKAA